MRRTKRTTAKMLAQRMRAAPERGVEGALLSEGATMIEALVEVAEWYRDDLIDAGDGCDCGEQGECALCRLEVLLG